MTVTLTERNMQRKLLLDFWTLLRKHPYKYLTHLRITLEVFLV